MYYILVFYLTISARGSSDTQRGADKGAGSIPGRHAANRRRCRRGQVGNDLHDMLSMFGWDFAFKSTHNSAYMSTHACFSKEGVTEGVFTKRGTENAFGLVDLCGVKEGKPRGTKENERGHYFESFSRSIWVGFENWAWITVKTEVENRTSKFSVSRQEMEKRILQL